MERKGSNAINRLKNFQKVELSERPDVLGSEVMNLPVEACDELVWRAEGLTGHEG
jgi:hypothetical protein